MNYKYFKENGEEDVVANYVNEHPNICISIMIILLVITKLITNTF